MPLPARLSALVLLLPALAGCESARPEGFAAALPAPPPARAPSQVGDGAIFQTAGGYAPLHYGHRAFPMGDPLTVLLTERTVSAKAARSRTQRDGNLSITPPAAGPLRIDPAALSAGASSSFKGSGDTGQNSSLAGELTVTIAEVLPGGVVRIRGEKLMRLGREDEWVQLSGLVRLADISADNSVASPRVADARITYGGKGSVQRAAREGWLGRFFSLVSPF